MRKDEGVFATTVLLDLDGTLVDSAAGILGSLREAFDELGLPFAGAEQLGTQLLGPPMYETLPPIIGAEATREVVPVYRRIYAERGLLSSTPYPGVDELLRTLSEDNRRLALATSKVEYSARRILDNRGWTPLFTAIVGDTDDAGRPTKSAVIAEAMRQLDATPDDTVMVGDRSHDVVGAIDNGLPCLGAGWGYGRPGELTGAGATSVCDTVAELGEALALGTSQRT
ncbi:MAG TPA: HAD hydrolase-like protein [Pseudonocardia sp.]|nr:HAD hydrolase-like protein [Pseudonocardia sp.]